MRRVLPYLWVAILIGLIYNGLVFYSRWSSNHEAERDREQKEAEDARRTLDLLGQFKIPDFYAAPAQIRRGGQSRICYSTIGAKSVRIDPPVAEVWPAYGRCVEVSPRTTTGYTLLADDGSGHRVTRTVTVTVRP